MHQIERLKETASRHIARLTYLNLMGGNKAPRLATFASYLKWRRVLRLFKQSIVDTDVIKGDYCALCSFYYDPYGKGDNEGECEGCPLKEKGERVCNHTDSPWDRAFRKLRHYEKHRSPAEYREVEEMVDLLRTIYKSLLPSEHKAKYIP